MLTAAEIASMRATQELVLPDTCVIKRPQSTTTGAGGQRTSTPTTIGTEYCAMDVVTRESERVLAGRYADVPQYLFILKHNTAALLGDYLEYGGGQFYVIGKLEDGSWKTATRLVAVRHAA